MYSDKETALEALKHCINLDDPFSDLNCGAGCPLWKQCTGTDVDVILSDLLHVLLSMNISPDRTDKVFAAIPRCCSENLCNHTCPYWQDCRGEEITLLFRDIYSILKEAGAYEKTL